MKYISYEEKLAKLITHHSLNLKKGDVVQIKAETSAEPLVKAMYKEIIKLGAYPFLRLFIPESQEYMAKYASDEQLSYLPEFDIKQAEIMTAYIYIDSTINTKSLTNADHSKIALMRKTAMPVREIMNKRELEGKFRWSLCPYPNQSMAQDAEMSLDEYTAFVYEACKLNEDDPIAAWKKVEADDEVTENMPTHKTLFYGMLRKDRLLDIINNYILWSDDSKILSAYHQYFGVKKAIKSTETAIENKTGKAGILWHTQGSGKSFSMVFYTGNMIKKLGNPSIVVVTDRNDLDNQLYETFSKCSNYLKQEPVQIENREDLNEKLDNRKSGGIFFTTLQKFEEETGLFSNRDDILVLVDEAHRSHYGIDATIKFDKEKMKAYKKYGTAKYLHEAFPNATYIGFTGTPVETKDKSTSNVFGDVIDTYDMTQAIMDGATVPIMYEARMARVGLNQKILDEIDDYYNYLEREEDVEEYKINESKKEMAKMSQIIEDPDRLQMIVEDIIKQYEQIETSVANKAMVVAYSRNSAYTMYKNFLELKPNWKNKVHMVITSNIKYDEEMQIAI